MKVIILNSAPGVGKSTLLKMLETTLPKGFAIIDGDDVGRIVPLTLSIEWLNLMQDNIVSCAKNYRDFGIEYLIVSFVFPSQERLDRLTSLMSEEDIEVLCRFSLFCDEKELEQRIKKRNTSRIMNVERALDCNAKIRDLETELLVNTTDIEPQEVARIFYDSILKITKEA